MTEHNINVSAPAGDKPVVLMATNVTYEPPKPLASGYAFSVSLVEEDEDTDSD